MLPFTLLRLAFVFGVADLTHAVTLIGTGVASLSVTTDTTFSLQGPGSMPHIIG